MNLPSFDSSRYRRPLFGAAAAGLLFLFPAAERALAAGRAPLGWGEPDDAVVAQLDVDPSASRLVDRGGKSAPTIVGGTLVSDARFGQVLEFGGDAGNEIRLRDDGRSDFRNGFTFECWLNFAAPSSKQIKGALFVKHGTAVTEIKDGQVDVKWMIFPRKTIFAIGKQFNYYPVSTESFNGSRQLPTGQWVHVAITYDPVMRVIRTWIDGGVDRTRYLVREEALPLQSDPQREISLFKGMTNFKVAGVRIASEAREFGALPSMEVYCHELPYRGKGEAGLVIDHVRPDLKFPVDMTVYWENHTGSGEVIGRFQLDGPERKAVTLPLPGWKTAPYTMVVDAYSENRHIFSKTVQMSNAGLSEKPQVKILPGGGISVRGKKRFPLVIYRVPPEDFETVKSLGFSVATPSDPNVRLARANETAVEAMGSWFKAADKADLFLMPAATVATQPFITKYSGERQLLAWIAADEPWGLSLERLRNNYVSSKLMAPDVPIYIVQNNSSRVQETSEMCDIVARDPYPIPNVSLRSIADETRQTLRDTGGLKPVWIIIPQYETKLPTYEQLRCMAYLAIVSGANGLGVYSWDDRSKDKSGALHGWYAKDHPENVEILGKVIKELASIEEDILVTPNSAGTIRFEPANEALHAAIKETPNGRYLLLVSDSRKDEEATLKIEGVQTAALKDRFQPEEVLQVQGGAAKVKLEPYAVKVFRIE